MVRHRLEEEGAEAEEGVEVVVVVARCYFVEVEVGVIQAEGQAFQAAVVVQLADQQEEAEEAVEAVVQVVQMVQLK